MNPSLFIKLLASLLFSLSLCQNLSAQKLNQRIKTEQYYYLQGIKESPDLQFLNLEQLPKKPTKELDFDSIGRIIQEKNFGKIGPIVHHGQLEGDHHDKGYTIWADSTILTEKIKTYSYKKDTITRKEFDETGALMFIQRYKEKKNGSQIFESTLFRVPDFKTPGIFSKPSRSKVIYQFNLNLAEQESLVRNMSDTIPTTFRFINEEIEDGWIKSTSTKSVGTWPPEQENIKYTDPKTGKTAIHYSGSTYEEVDLTTFSSSPDTLKHRVYQKKRVKFGHDQTKRLTFRPNQLLPGDTLKHEETLTLTPNDSTRIISRIFYVGAPDIRKMEEHYLHGLLTKKTVSKLEAGAWVNYETRNYIRYGNYCLLEIDAKRRKKEGRFKSYFLSVYEFY